jgi:prolyl-tRNA synthetase
MKFSQLFMPTLREDPAEAEVVSHKLMVRAGLIRKLASGIYSWLPVGLRSLRKVENIIRDEMNRAGAQEILMPAVQPGDIWKESGRWTAYGKELLRFKDRHDHEYCLGPTHEEVVTDIMRREIRSYRDLPVNLYQIQQKFRDEIRPRFGVMRGREFGMKDAYSFDKDDPGAETSYRAMFQAYINIFKRCGLRFTPVEADSGSIGGSFSHEFMVLAETGEDAIVHCASCGYAANTEKAPFVCSAQTQAQDLDAPPYSKVLTPGMHTVEKATKFLNIEAREMLKTMIYKTDNGPVAVLILGDREVNAIKLKKVVGGESDPELAPPSMVQEVTGVPLGFIGPVGLNMPMLADIGVRALGRVATGGNEPEYHIINVVPGRDFSVTEYHDLSAARPGDLCPQCQGTLTIARGIEVGHVFKLGDKYSKAMGATFLNAEGKKDPIIMGCYGIGIGRTVAASIEQNHDESGIIWPMPLAPFEVTVLPLQAQDPEIMAAAEKLYQDLLGLGVEALLDDRDERAGIKFKDADLVGIPFRVSVSRKSLAAGQVEFKERRSSEVRMIPLAEAAQTLLGWRNDQLAQAKA